MIGRVKLEKRKTNVPFDYLIELDGLIKIHNRTKNRRILKKTIKKMEKFNFLWEL